MLQIFKNGKVFRNGDQFDIQRKRSISMFSNFDHSISIKFSWIFFWDCSCRFLSNDIKRLVSFRAVIFSHLIGKIGWKLFETTQCTIQTSWFLKAGVLSLPYSEPIATCNTPMEREFTQLSEYIWFWNLLLLIKSSGLYKWDWADFTYSHLKSNF